MRSTSGKSVMHYTTGRDAAMQQNPRVVHADHCSMLPAFNTSKRLELVNRL